ncbi:hypothetical protein ABT354_21245 [Streptomyces sp. NPDC000594]|uniref:ARPP-2 domain-containing protein n=1 Tax=Streptomyces sp. NPDC000594 TaxID=3154261 RepID=UPI003333013B
MSRLDLTGLTARPAQVWGGIRLVPLVRDEPVAGLRLRPEARGAADGSGELCDPGADGLADEVAYIPHGLVVDWSDGPDGPGSGSDPAGPGSTGSGPTAVYGTQLGGAAGERAGRRGRGRPAPPVRIPLRDHQRLVRRHRSQGSPEPRLRFLPLRLALDGYLSLHFGGPPVVWEEWTRRAVRQGLPPRSVAAYTGRQVPGLAEALRIFEIHPGQCGVLVYAADSLAAAFAVPHPEDYRVLHPTLVEDLYGEVVHQYAFFGAPVPEFTAELGDGRHIRSLADLRAAARGAERAWEEGHSTLMAARLLDAPYAFRRVYTLGSFTLWRFLPSFRRGEPEQHIGETITDHKGRVAFLKTFRLSEAQTGRAYLLQRLHEHDWHLDRTAEAIGTDRADLVRRLREAGFDELLKQGAERHPRTPGAS